MMSLESFARLGWAFARVLGRRLVGRPPQLARFIAQYHPDGIVLFEARDAAVVRAASRCIACGQCDTAALITGRFDALGPRGPMAFVLGVARHTGEHDAAELGAAADDALLDALTAACPVGVPFAPLTALVRRRAADLAQVRAARHDAA